MIFCCSLDGLLFQHLARLFSVAPPDFGCEIFTSLMHLLLVSVYAGMRDEVLRLYVHGTLQTKCIRGCAALLPQPVAHHGDVPS